MTMIVETSRHNVARRDAKGTTVRHATRRGGAGALALVAALGVALAPRVARAAASDVRLTGLPPLLQALEAVSNCTGLAVDDRRFRRAATLYSLLPDDLTPYGRFPAVVADLQATYRRQILDDRLAFCSAARLRYAVKDGILTDLDRDPARR